MSSLKKGGRPVGLQGYKVKGRNPVRERLEPSASATVCVLVTLLREAPQGGPVGLYFRPCLDSVFVGTITDQ